MTDKQDMRGKCFVPKWGVCKGCGAPIWKTAAHEQYCDRCRDAKEEHKKEQARIRAKRHYYKAKKEVAAGIDPNPNRKHEKHVCEDSWRCLYGVRRADARMPGCSYFGRTGKLRTVGGKHKIVNGRCDLFVDCSNDKPGWMKTRDIRRERKEAKGGDSG